jgi:chromosome segregation protein
LAKESAERHIADFTERRETARAEHRRLADHLQATGNERQEKWNHAHAHELRANELKLRQIGLCDRIKEDYQVDLVELYEGQEKTNDSGSSVIPHPPTLSASAVQPEIEELRRKLARLGAVNLDALQELADLEKRVTEKQTQHDDLSKSRHDLLSIIDKINQDSKTLFTETFATIRMHFQDLFRRLFGGGMADVLLEDETDILECGIEINARPPGKDLRSISLMSGGERTLTCIALLLAIFRSKPSPFCMLDEVDAALDEANNTRLSGVLREFQAESQFILVTHKKRTMAIADVLYGITMQESGVSKQVSVRFEDWPEDKDEAEVEAA